MIFRMDTDSVRAMAARFRRTASTMDTSLASIRQSVRSAPWQSQAREEFIQQLEMLHNSTLRSAEVLRMMALAAEQKANQWEAIGDRFNGPWQAMGNAWGQLKSMMGWLWSRIKGAITGIRLPSIPKFVVPATTVGVILNALISKPPWLNWPPSWWLPKWPPEPKSNPESSGISDGSGDESTSSTATIEFPAINYEEMNWSDKFRHFDEFRKELADIENGTLSGSEERIKYLKDEINKLSSIITTGIPADGPTKTSWVNYLGGCTHYVATKKRNVADFGRQNAHTWNENAVEAGYEVSNLPIPGSIIVFEANTHGYKNAGHVGFVESVKLVNGGYEIVFSHASTIRPDPNSWVRGDHNMNPNKSMTIPYGGENNISFICDKL